MFLGKLKSKGHRGWYSLTSHFRSEQKSAAAADGNLFPLPLELVEEIALYFTRSEAAKVLTVNSVFHDAFSHSVWSYVYLRDWNAHLIPKSAWKKYGHLVCTAAVALEKNHTLPAISMPNLVELDIYINSQSLRLFERAKLPHLRRLYMLLDYGKWTRADFKTGVELAQRLKRTGQPVEVGWRVCAMTYDNMLILDEMLGMAGDTAFDSLWLMTMLISGPVTTLSHLPKLASLLNIMTYSRASVFHTIFGSDTSLIFPQLELLELDILNLADYSIGPDIITPQHLPALKKLWLVTLQFKDQQWISNIMNSGEWSNLTELNLFGCTDILDFKTIAARTPNLEHLKLSRCSFRLDIAEIGSLLPRLEYLLLGGSIKFEYDVTQDPRPQHTSLKTLEFQYDLSWLGEQIMSLPLLQFILCGAPNLESLGVYGCGVSMDDLKTLSGHANPSVRTLHIESTEKRFNSDSVAAMVALFPNLKKYIFTDREHTTDAGELLGRRSVGFRTR
ncbi:hypothetical protein GQ42DRAFT_38300 [Ramicandelaber brevisporus]|nr:hypothetical protein GQ42DRAFT_38300 [Ramicandelaber brevisporus]